jgi:hypothetical protein
MVETGMRKECFVDGDPHKNRSVISAATGTSHDSDVSTYARIMQCTPIGRTDKSFPCGPLLHPELLILYKMDSGGHAA